MEELKNVVRTLFSLQTQVHHVVETLNTIGNNYELLRDIKLENFHVETNLEISSHSIISNYSIILFCSFMDEYDFFFNQNHLSSEFQNRINIVKQKNKPGIKRIKEWKDLKKFRNQIAAHNFRIKKKSFFSDEFEQFTFKIPNKISEKNLFSGIIYLLCLNIRNAFPEIKINSSEVMLDKMKLIGEEVDNEKELEKLIKLMI